MRALLALALMAAGIGAALALPDRIAAAALVPGLVAALFTIRR